MAIVPGGLSWQSEDRCVVGETTFQTLPVDLLDRDQPRISTEGANFLLLKERPLIERYVALLEQLRPRRIFELGVLEGGGTAMLAELARPSLMVAIDHKAPTKPTLRRHIAQRGMGEAVLVYDDVDQGDRGRLAEIARDVFDGQPLDLVVDDCSHLYWPTRAAFNELFPRLRPGGVYMIEDWPWAHEHPVAELWADQIPLTRLVVELTLAMPVLPDLIGEITVDADVVQITRGDASADPFGFDICEHLDAAGQSLLA